MNLLNVSLVLGDMALLYIGYRHFKRRYEHWYERRLYRKSRR